LTKDLIERSGVDVKSTKSLQQRNARKRNELQKNSEFLCLKYPEEECSSSISEDSKAEESTVEEIDLSEEDVKLDKQADAIKPSQMRSNLTNLARECDRQGVLDRAAAALASAVLQDVGIVHDGDSSIVIDRSKIRRERVKVRRRLQVSSVKHVSGLYFDGRKDKTRVQVKKGKKSYPHILTEEHVTLVSEPNSQYLEHITPASGTSKHIQSAFC